MDAQEIRDALEVKFAAVQKELQDAQAKNASKEELLKLHDSIKIQGEALDNFIDSQKSKVVKTYLQELGSFIKENQTKIKEIYKGGSGEISFIPKAVGDISTVSGSDVDVPPVHVSTNLNSFNLRNDNALMNLFTVTSTDSPQLSYTDMLPKEGDYEFVLEGGVKPQIDFSWENRYETPKKVAAYEILTEESVTDYARMMSVAREYLTKKHDLFKVNNLFFAAGTGDLPIGATVYGRTFVAGTLAEKLPLGSANFMDVVNAIITDIYSTQNFADEAEYMANVVLISPADFFLNLVAAKDGQGLPLYPSASLFNEVRIGGVMIKPWQKIPAGKIFVGDMKVYNVVNYVPFTIRIGWINNQFITNKFTMLGESRYFQYVRNLDQAALVYDDIATVKGAIEAIS